MGISTIFDELPMVGEFGHIFGSFNKSIFGPMGYIYPFLLILPIYVVYRDSGDNIDNIFVFSISVILLFIAMLILQSILFDSESGYLSQELEALFTQYIGELGTLLLIVTMLIISFNNLFDIHMESIKKRVKGIVNVIYNVLKNIFNFDLPKGSKKPDDTLLELTIYENYETDRVNQNKNNKNSDISIDIDSIEQDLINSINPTQPTKNENENKQISPNITIKKELDENKKLLSQIDIGRLEIPKNFKLPKLDFLKNPPKQKKSIDESEIDYKIKNLLEKLKQFKIEGDVVATYSGPVVTTFEFKPQAHIKVSKILTLQDDLAMALKATTIRIQAPIPGKDVVGIEIPNINTQTIYLREILKSNIFQNSSSPLTMVVGKDIVGNPFVTDLKRLPHLLIAGTTGSGKSVGINAMLVSLLYRNSPDDLKLLMIDPKMLEFSIYNDIPHLLTPVITGAKQAILALSNMVIEMEKRYKLMAKTKTKNIENFNEKAKKNGYESFAYIVVIIDELADLMMTSGKDVEFYIARLAQMARASGIHLIVATQRPSVDVVTGLIKANLPSRMSFKVGQKIDSKVILDTTGADSLLGKGDMLFTPPGSSALVRLHAPFITEEEIERVVEFLKLQREVVYDDSFLSEPSSDNSTVITDSPTINGDFDELFEEAKNVVLTDKKTSISYIQRKLQIGYNRSARIIEQLEMTGVLSAPNHKGHREILQG
jgi:S-DNA-T family DNA segregation ATPase FtsK/SpoIIIE